MSEKLFNIAVNEMIDAIILDLEDMVSDINYLQESIDEKRNELRRLMDEAEHI